MPILKGKKKEGHGTGDTYQKLLEECNSGCKMGINSMKQIREYIKDEKLRDLTDEYIRKHQDLELETSPAAGTVRGRGKSTESYGLCIFTGDD